MSQVVGVSEDRGTIQIPCLFPQQICNAFYFKMPSNQQPEKPSSSSSHKEIENQATRQRSNNQISGRPGTTFWNNKKSISRTGTKSIQHISVLKSNSERWKLINELKSLIATLCTEQTLYRCEDLYSVKNHIENNKTIDANTKIDVYRLADMLEEGTREAFAQVLRQQQVIFDKYFLLKSFVYITGDIKYKLLKGDEISKYK